MERRRAVLCCAVPHYRFEPSCRGQKPRVLCNYWQIKQTFSHLQQKIMWQWSHSEMFSFPAVCISMQLPWRFWNAPARWYWRLSSLAML